MSSITYVDYHSLKCLTENLTPSLVKWDLKKKNIEKYRKVLLQMR